MSGKFDAIVIGSGIGGLTCGAFLSRAGMRVLVLEKHSVVGGYAHGFRRKSYCFDSGIHSVSMAPDGLVMHLLRLLGVQDQVQPIELPSMYEFQIPDFSFVVPTRAPDIRDKLIDTFPHQRTNILGLLDEMKRFHTVLAEPIFDFERAVVDEDKEFLSRFHRRSYRDYLRGFLDDPKLRQIFYAMWPYGGSSPDSAPVVFYTMMFTVHYLEGSHRIKGGFSMLGAALAKAITDAGGQIRTRSEVVRLVTDGRDRARSVVLRSGEEFEADQFVSNISPYTLHLNLVDKEHRSKLWARRLGSLHPSVSCVAAYLGLSKPLETAPDNPILFRFDNADHGATYQKVLRNRLDSPDHLIVLSQPDSGPAPAIMLMRFARREASADWKTDKRRLADAMLDTAETMMPGLKQSISVMEVGSPSTFERFTGNTGGALYGFENTSDMYGEAKLPLSTYIRNLYQTGHWGKPGGGVWNVMANGYTAAKLIERDVPHLSPKKTGTPNPAGPLRLRLIYPRFRKFLEGHGELHGLLREHLVGNYTMPPSLALPIIAALTPPEIEIGLIDDNIGDPVDYDEKIDCAVISCFTPQAGRAYEIADEFRKRGTRVILGGIHPSGIPQEALEHADAVCVGEAEPVWPRILDDLRGGKLAGIYQAPENYDLDRMPVPKREIFGRGKYHWDAHLVLTTRGCPVRCEGCPIPNKEGTPLRFRPVARVIEDIRGMPYREFYFTDDTVMLPGKRNMKYLLGLMERTRELDVSIFLASTMMMVSDPGFYVKLKQGGATSMYTVFGFDRASRTLLNGSATSDEWRRGVDLVRMIEDAGIHFFASFGVGFDDQDPGIFDRILRFSQDAGIDLAEFYIHTPFPGTPFGERAQKEGRILHRNYTLWNTGNVVFRPRNMTEEELLRGFLHLWQTFYRDKDPRQTLKSFDVNASKPASAR